MRGLGSIPTRGNILSLDFISCIGIIRLVCEKPEMVNNLYTDANSCGCKVVLNLIRNLSSVVHEVLFQNIQLNIICVAHVNLINLHR